MPRRTSSTAHGFSRRTCVAFMGGLAVAGPVAVQAASAPAISWDEVRVQMRAFLREQTGPSLNVAVAMNGRLVFGHAEGFADRARRIVSTPNTAYSVASITKPIVGLPQAQSAAPRAPAPAVTPPAIPSGFVGQWRGQLRADESTTSFAFRVDADGHACAGLGDAAMAPVDDLAYIDGFLYGCQAPPAHRRTPAPWPAPSIKGPRPAGVIATRSARRCGCTERPSLRACEAFAIGSRWRQLANRKDAEYCDAYRP